MDYPLPDGTYIRNVPEGTTRQEVMARLINAGQAERLGFTTPDPTEGMGEIEKARAGWGKFLSEGVMGLRQRLGGATGQEVEEMNRRDAPLMATGAGKIGYFGSALAHTVPTAFIPGANTLAGSAAIGAGLGAIAPTERTEDPLANVLRSAAFGLGGQAVGRLASGAPLVASRLNPAQRELVDLATQRYGMDLPVSARTGSPRAAYLESQIATLPGGGRMQEALRRPQEQLAQRVMQEAGGEGLATTANLAAARASTRGGYQNIWRDVDIPIDGQFTTELDAAWRGAQRMLSRADAGIVRRQINNIWEHAAPASPTQLTIPGDVYQMSLRGELRNAMPAQGPLREALRGVQRALDGMANRAVGRSGSEALRQLNREYAIQRGVERLIPAAEARGGTFTPSGLLPEFGGAPGTMGELARIGPMLREPPQSGTATRQLVGGALLGGPAYAMTGSPEVAVAGLAMPWMGARALSSPAMQRYLAGGFGNLTARQREMITAAARGGALTTPGLLGLQ